jgi:hypothetical protein
MGEIVVKINASSILFHVDQINVRCLLVPHKDTPVMLVLVFVTLLIAGGCGGSNRVEKDQPAAQGLHGKVVKMTGDFMPGPEPPSGTIRPLSVPVHIFRGKVTPFSRPNRNHPRLVKIVKSDSDGYFRCGMPPGEYAAVAEIDGQLHEGVLGSTPEHKWFWFTVVVEPDKWIRYDIQDHTEATF